MVDKYAKIQSSMRTFVFQKMMNRFLNNLKKYLVILKNVGKTEKLRNVLQCRTVEQNGFAGVRSSSLIEFWTLNTIFACEKKMGYEKQAGKTLVMKLLRNSKSVRPNCELKRGGKI